MFVSQECHYALRAVLELASRYRGGSAKNSEIAEVQAIPPRFLEVILSELKRGGFVSSRRGSSGGYVLLHDPAKLKVGSVIRFIQGPVEPAESVSADSGEKYSFGEPSALARMWERVRKAVTDIYDTTTFQDLLDEEMRLRRRQFVPSYAI